MKKAGQQMEDETGWRFRVRSMSPENKVRVSLISALAALVIMVTVWLISRSWEAAGIAASLLGLAWIILPNILLGVPLTPSGWLRWIGSPLSALISIVLYVTLPTTYVPWWWYAGLFTLPLLVVLESIASFWRNFKLETSELRSCLIRCLLKNFRDSYIAIENGRQEVEKAIDEVMLWTAHTVYMNPWNRLLRYFVPTRMAHPGVTSLWLLRPFPPDSNVEFKVSNHAVVGPPRVGAVFDRFREKYRPRINLPELSRVQERLKREGLAPEEEFLKDSLKALKAEYVSLPGLVFCDERGLDGDDACSFWGFEYTHYREVIEQETGDDQALLKDSSWKAFAAYPVYSGGPQHGRPPSGVLAAFSNTKNGILNRDRNILVSAARFIGILLGKGAIVVAHQGSDRGPVNPEAKGESDGTDHNRAA